MSLLRRFGAPGLALLCASACAGSSFELAEEQAAAGQGGGFPPLSTTDNQGGAGGSTAGVAGSGGAAGSGGGAAGSGGAPAGPTPSACGDLRPAGVDDAEVCIPAGTFTMGSADTAVPQAGDYVPHQPEHQVTLAAYVLDMYEVTVSRYRACVGAGACVAPSTAIEQSCTYTPAASDRDHFPVTCVTWDDADTFCAWDGSRRLPTEAEWERAARGSTGTTYAWGNDVSCAKAVFGGSAQCDQHAGTTPKAVGSAPRGASLEGAMDLTGNVWEWVHDYFGPYSSSAADNPLGPTNGSQRIQRGGNWLTPPPNAAAYMRRSLTPLASSPSSFRCARSAP